MAIATGAAIALAASAAASAGAGVYAANKQAGAAKDATSAQTNAANYAADVQAKSAADTLAYTKQQQAQARADADVTQRANYDQWVAAQQYQNAQAAGRTSSINALGAQYGVAPRANPTMTIPAYHSILSAALPADGASGAAAAPGGAASSPAAPAAVPTGAPAVSAANGDIGQQVSAYFKSRGVSDQETPYWVQKWAEFGVKDPAYFNQRLAAADVFGGGGGAAAPATIRAAILPTRASGAMPSVVPAATGGYVVPVTAPLTVAPYQRRTVGDYFG